jgi:hypothetical protein
LRALFRVENGIVSHEKLRRRRDEEKTKLELELELEITNLEKVTGDRSPASSLRPSIAPVAHLSNALLETSAERN